MTTKLIGVALLLGVAIIPIFAHAVLAWKAREYAKKEGTYYAGWYRLGEGLPGVLFFCPFLIGYAAFLYAVHPHTMTLSILLFTAIFPIVFTAMAAQVAWQWGGSAVGRGALELIAWYFTLVLITMLFACTAFPLEGWKAQKIAWLALLILPHFILFGVYICGYLDMAQRRLLMCQILILAGIPLMASGIVGVAEVGEYYEPTGKLSSDLVLALIALGYFFALCLGYVFSVVGLAFAAFYPELVPKEERIREG